MTSATAQIALMNPAASAVLPQRAIYVYSYAYAPLQGEGYDVDVPNKTIYVSDGDLKLYQRAQELAGGNLSAAIANALKRYVDVQEGLREGFDDVVVRVGVGAGPQGPLHRRPGRRVARLPRASAPSTTASGAAAPASTSSTSSASRSAWMRRPGGQAAPAGAADLGIGDVRYGSAPEESTLDVFATARRAPRQVSRRSSSTWSRAAARQPTVEELDI